MTAEGALPSRLLRPRLTLLAQRPVGRVYHVGYMHPETTSACACCQPSNATQHRPRGGAALSGACDTALPLPAARCSRRGGRRGGRAAGGRALGSVGAQRSGAVRRQPATTTPAVPSSSRCCAWYRRSREQEQPGLRHHAGLPQRVADLVDGWRRARALPPLKRRATNQAWPDGPLDRAHLLLPARRACSSSNRNTRRQRLWRRPGSGRTWAHAAR